MIFDNTRPRVLVLGTGKDATELAETLSGKSGYEVLGFLGPDDGDASPVLGPLEVIERALAECTPVDIVAVPLDADKALADRVYAVCRARGTEVLQMVTPLEGFKGQMSVEAVGETYALVERAS